MVRLKEKEVRTILNNNYLFQFQYGAIKSLQGVATEWRKKYFNSNMVRLKAKRK